jgi:hypothetical protein
MQPMNSISKNDWTSTERGGQRALSLEGDWQPGGEFEFVSRIRSKSDIGRGEREPLNPSRSQKRN